MSSALEALVCCAVVPVAVAGGVGWILQRLIRSDASASIALTLGIAAGFFAGYLLVTPSLAPQRHWQWLPYLGVAAATTGAAGIATRASAPLRWILFLALASGSAFLLVPTWPTLQPPRLALMALLAIYFVLLMSLLDALPDRLTGSSLPLLFALSAAAVAVLVAAEVSLTYGQLAGIAAAAIAGGYLSALLSKQAPAARGAAPVFAILAGGVAFVGAIEPEQPVFGILLAPLAPLMLWCVAFGPLAKLNGFAAAAVQTIAVLIPLLIAIALVFWRSAAYE